MKIKDELWFQLDRTLVTQVDSIQCCKMAARSQGAVCICLRYVFCRVISSPADSVAGRALEWSHFGLTALESVGQAPYIKRIAIAGADRALNARAARTRARGQRCRISES